MWSKIRAVWSRELLDTVRDKRTVYMMILLPIVIMPVIMMVGPVVMVRQQEALQEETAVVAFHGGSVPAELVAFLETAGGFAVEGAAAAEGTATAEGAATAASVGAGSVGAGGGAVDGGTVAGGAVVGGTAGAGVGARAAGDVSGEDLARWRERLAGGEIHLVVSLSEDAAGLWAAEEPIPVELLYYGSSNRSAMALQRFEAMLQAFGAQVGAARLAQRGLPPELVQPFQVTGTRDVTPREQMAGRMLGMFVPFFIVVWAVMGGMYTAIDAAAGEKERNSLETLVMVPAPTAALVLGKFLAVMTVTLVAVMLLIGSSVGSMLYIMPKLLGAEAMTVSVQAGHMALLFVVMALFVALTSAVELGLSVYSKSYREAQAYMTALAFLVMLPSMYLMFAETEAVAVWTYLVPVLNVLFIVRDVLEGSLPGAAPVLLTLGSLVATAGAALWGTQRAFRNERVIFRT